MAGSQYTPGITQGPARGGPAPLRSPRESRSLGGRALGRRPLPPCRCGVMPECRTARRHRPHIGGRVRHRVVAEAKADHDGVSTSNVLPRVRAVCRGTRFERRMRVLVASPACPAHFGGRRTRNRRSAGHGSGRACRWRACGCTTASGARTPIRAPWTWLGGTPPLGKPRLAPRGMEPDSPIPPSAAGSLPASDPLREGQRRVAPTFGSGCRRGRHRPRCPRSERDCSRPYGGAPRCRRRLPRGGG